MNRGLLAFFTSAALVLVSLAWTGADEERDVLPRYGVPSTGIKLADRLYDTFHFHGFDDPKMTLQEGLDFLSKRSFRFNVNEQAFKAAEVPDVLRTEIANPNPVPEMIDVQFVVVLQKILSRVPAPTEAGRAMFLLRKDHIEITTGAAIRAELGRPENEPLPPLVHANFEKRPLEDAIKQLGDQVGYSVVLDGKVGDKATMAVTVKLKNAPLDSAVRLLADSADLDMVQVDNLLYVTTRENALRIEATQQKLRRMRAEQAKKLQEGKIPVQQP
jgi:hypothetical protein